MFPEAGRFRRAIAQAAAAVRGAGGPVSAKVAGEGPLPGNARGSRPGEGNGPPPAPTQVPQPRAGGRVTGVIVPHHLLAIDLIARGFQAAAGNRFRRIILLCPDHFRRSHTPFAVGLRDFSSCLGPVPTDVRAVRWLAAHSLVSVSNLFSHEHGVQALLPFLAHHFPGTPVVCVAIRATARPADWARLARLLGPLCGPGTLVVQSTDFSHGLPAAAAAAHDRESVAAILSGDPARAVGLHQPRHIDCRGALFVQMCLQAARGAVPAIIAAGNAQRYAPPPLADVTSYLVAVFRVPKPPAVTIR